MSRLAVRVAWRPLLSLWILSGCCGIVAQGQTTDVAPQEQTPAPTEGTAQPNLDKILGSDGIRIGTPLLGGGLGTAARGDVVAIQATVTPRGGTAGVLQIEATISTRLSHLLALSIQGTGRRTTPHKDRADPAFREWPSANRSPRTRPRANTSTIGPGLG